MFYQKDDDDDDDEDDSVAQTITNPAQQATQQVASSPVTSDAQPAIAVDEAIADNIDDLNAVDGLAPGVESDAKDPQQLAQDQAATINNTIDPVGNEAIVDDEEGRNLLKIYFLFTFNKLSVQSFDRR